MTKRKKVIKEFELFIKEFHPACTSEGVELNMFREVLALLKEQETKWIHRADMDYKDKNGVVHFHGMCESCGFIHDFIDGHTGQYKFCPECGRKVKWE